MTQYLQLLCCAAGCYMSLTCLVIFLIVVNGVVLVFLKIGEEKVPNELGESHQKSE